MADNTEKKCEYCGASYIVSDGYCRHCWKRLPDAVSPKEELLNGVKKADWHFFIDKNASRYVDIYSENENVKTLFKFQKNSITVLFIAAAFICGAFFKYKFRYAVCEVGFSR